jgi:hypothetical protein
LKQDKEPTTRRMSMSSGYGPLQLNGIGLLDLPFLSLLKPIASTSSARDFPHVATAPDVPGPTSLPGGLIVCTLLPEG